MKLLAIVVVLVAAGCETPQSDICKEYIACQAAYDEASDTGPVDTSQYEADGACWGGAENAATCDQQCSDGIDALLTAADDANLDVPACQG